MLSFQASGSAGTASTVPGAGPPAAAATEAGVMTGTGGGSGLAGAAAGTAARGPDGPRGAYVDMLFQLLVDRARRGKREEGVNEGDKQRR